MPPSQYDNLMRRLDDVSQQIQDLDKKVDTESHRLSTALYGGNGDGPGIFERFRNIFDWREEHISSHEHAGQERRSSSTDWRRFWIGVADRTFTVVFAILGILLVYFVTGHVVTFP